MCTIKERPGAGVGGGAPKMGKFRNIEEMRGLRNLIRGRGWRRKGAWLSISPCRDHGAALELNKQETCLRMQITVQYVQEGAKLQLLGKAV